MLALVLAFGVVPGVPSRPTLPDTTWGLAAGIAGEMAFGLAMGMILSFVFIAAQWAGEMIGQQMGLNLSEVFDPQFGGQGSIVGDMYFMLTLVVFLVVGGHHAMLRGVRDSFDALPLLSLGVDADAVRHAHRLLQRRDRRWPSAWPPRCSSRCWSSTWRSAWSARRCRR